MITDETFIQKDPSWDDDGWTKVPNEIARDSNLSLEARGLILYLASHSTAFRVRLLTIQKAVGVGREKLRRLMNELDEAGYLDRQITWQRVDGMNRRGPSRYILRRSRRSAEVTGFQAPGIEAPETEAAGIEALQSEALQNPPHIKKNTSKKTISEEDHRKKTSDDVAETLFQVAVAAPAPTFEDFWLTYDKKVGKCAAQLKWGAVLKRGADPTKIVAAAARYRGCFGADKKYMKNPDTWLNQGCYDDEDLPTNSSTRQSYSNPTPSSYGGSDWADAFS